MLCNIKPVPFHESDKHILPKFQGGSGPPVPPPPLDPPMLCLTRYHTIPTFNGPKEEAF